MMIEYERPPKFEFCLLKPDGRKFYTNILVISKILNRMKKGYSPIILIVGSQRSGKSFIAIWLSNIITQFFHNQNFDPFTNTFYDPVKIIDGLGEREKQTIVIDEAGAYLNKQEWYNRVVKAFDKIIQTQGYLCNCYIFISPFGSDIAKTFRKHFDFQLYLKKRGDVIVRQIPKKYASMNDDRLKLFFLERISVNKTDLDTKLWDQYEEYSMSEKDKLRVTLSKVRTSKDTRYRGVR